MISLLPEVETGGGVGVGVVCWGGATGVGAAGAGVGEATGEDTGSDSGAGGGEAQAKNTKVLRINNKQKNTFFISNSFKRIPYSNMKVNENYFHLPVRSSALNTACPESGLFPS